MFFQCHVVEKVFQNLRMRLKFRIRQAMEIQFFVAHEIQYFEIGIFSFNFYVYYLARDFIAPTRACIILTCAFNLPTRAFNLATRAFSLLTHGFVQLVTRGFELVTCELELVIRGFELVTRNSCFTFPLKNITQKTVKQCTYCLDFNQFYLPGSSLLTTYETFIRNQLDFADVIDDQAYNSFHEKLESLQYNARLVITEAIRGTSLENLY